MIVLGCGALFKLGKFLRILSPMLQVWAKLAAWALDWTPRCLQRCSGTRELITHNEWGQ